MRVSIYYLSKPDIGLKYTSLDSCSIHLYEAKTNKYKMTSNKKKKKKKPIV